VGPTLFKTQFLPRQTPIVKKYTANILKETAPKTNTIHDTEPAKTNTVGTFEYWWWTKFRKSDLLIMISSSGIFRKTDLLANGNNAVV
jgi:hypothetical protein